MSQPADRPLVTFFVIAYNQERFVREAIEGAFAQTYRPLEIILSDDCSPDGTFRVMEEMAAAYEGPHRVILNRNPVNLGIIRHINAIVSLCSGELLVQNAGDDVSGRDRVSRLVETWNTMGRDSVTLYSAATIIDQAGKRIGRRGPNPRLSSAATPAKVLEEGLITLGATCAWSRSLFETFGPLSEVLLVEDLSTTFRSVSIGRIVYLDEELVSWRTGGLSWNPGRNPGWEALYGTLLTYVRWRAASYRSVLEDLDSPVFKPHEAERLRRICRHKLAELEHQIALADAKRLRRAALTVRGLPSLPSLKRLKTEMKYNFDFIYVPYAFVKGLVRSVFSHNYSR